jgi:hypothetical protein
MRIQRWVCKNLGRVATARRAQIRRGRLRGLAGSVARRDFRPTAFWAPFPPGSSLWSLQLKQKVSLGIRARYRKAVNREPQTVNGEP